MFTLKIKILTNFDFETKIFNFLYIKTNRFWQILTLKIKILTNFDKFCR